MSGSPAIKDGKVRHYHHQLIGKDWKECYAVLHQDSTFTWLDDGGDHSVKLKDVAPYVAVGPYTKVVPNRPALPTGTTEYHLLAIGSGPSAPVNWFLFESDEELNSWMDKIVSTLPSAPAAPQQSAPVQGSAGPPRYSAPPPAYQRQAQPLPPNYAPPQQQQQHAPYGYYPPYPGAMAGGPAVAAQQPPASTTVIIQDQRQPAYTSGSSGLGSGLGSGFGGMGTGLAGGMLLGGALGYGLGSMSHSHWGGWGCGGGWGGGYGPGGGGWGGPSYSDNDTTVINNYYDTDSRTENNEYNNYGGDSGGVPQEAEEVYDAGDDFGGDDFGGDFDGDLDGGDF